MMRFLGCGRELVNHRLPPVLAGALAGLLFAVAEAVALGIAAWSLLWPLAAILVFAASSMGAIWAVAAGAAAMAKLSRPRFGALIGALCWPILALATGAMFEGSFAASLPGAATGHLWVPALGALAIAGAVWLGEAVTRRWPTAAAVALLTGAAMVDIVNRGFKPDEHPDLHTLLIAVCLALTTVGLSVGWPRTQSVRPRAQAAIVAAVFLWAGAAVSMGLTHPEDRRAVAGHKGRAGWIVRAVRAAVDVDGDGYSAALGGPDCNDRDDATYPGARDRDADGEDQDCDGFDGPPDESDFAAPAPPPDTSWREEPAMRARLAKLQRFDAVLITVDTLRADVLTDTAQNREDFPALFDLFDESVRFSRAFAPSAGTDLSLSGLLSGRVDPFSGVEQTLPEALQAAGHRTHAVLPSETLRYVGKTFLTRGLDAHRRLVNDLHERDVGDYATSPRVTDLALEFYKKHLLAHPQQPQLVWAHYFDVHEHHEIKSSDRHLKKVSISEANSRRVTRYRATVALVDQQVGRLLAQIRESGRWDKTIIIFTSDHGEGLGEDPRLPQNHGLRVYQPLVHVPLAIRVPGVAGRVSQTPVSLIDLFPTVADLWSTPSPPAMDGLSLAPILLAPQTTLGPAVDRPLPLHESEQVGVIRWPYKLIIQPADNLLELYNLEKDPAEATDLASQNPEIVRRLRAAYRGFPEVTLDRTRAGRRAREQAAVSAGAD